MVQQMMAMKVATRSVSRVGNEKGLLEGTTISTSDLNFVINENVVHIAESTVGRRYAGWFIRNAEHAQRVYDGLRNSPLPAVPQKLSQQPAVAATDSQPAASGSKPVGSKVAWGGVKVGA